MSCWFPSLTLIWKKHQQPHYQQEHDPLISRCSLSQSRLPSPKLTVASHFVWCKNVVSITRQMICIKGRARCFVVLSIVSSTCTAREERGHPCHKPGSPDRLCRAFLVTEHPPHSLSDVFYHLHQANKKQFLILPSGEKTYFRIWHYHLSQ